MSQQAIKLSNETDYLEAITHTLKKLLYESDDDILYQVARTQTIEKIESEGGTLSDDKFDELVRDCSNISITQKHNQDHISGVLTIGPRPQWLDAPDMDGETGNKDLNIPGLSQSTEPETRKDDFSQLDCLSEHQPEAFHEADFHTFRDIVDADMDELTSVPGINLTKAEDLTKEAQKFIDPIKEISQEAYNRERTRTPTDGESEEASLEPESLMEQLLQEDSGSTANNVTDVPIPSGEPRNEQLYKNNPANLEHDVWGLPILEKPQLGLETLTAFVDNAESLEGFIRGISQHIEFPTQASKFKEDMRDSFDSLADLREASFHPVSDDLTKALTQHSTTKEELENLIENHSINVAGDDPHMVAGDIDRAFQGELPEKARLRAAENIKTILEAEGTSTSDLTKDANLEGLVESSEVPIQLDHPFIDDPSDFPPIKTRELETGEEDLQLVARLIAKDNYPLDLIGHAGVGKDTIHKFLTAVTNRPSFVINMDESMISQNLMGIHKVNEDGSVEFEDGVIPHAAKYGFYLIISEVNAAAPEILTALHRALERDSKIHIKENDEIIVPSPRFRVGFTRNPPTKEYDGAKKLNDAFRRRINTITVDYLPTDQEADLIDAIVNENRHIIDKQDIQTLVRMANSFREQADSRGNQLPRISTTKLLHIIDIYDGSDDLMGATIESMKAEAFKESRRNEIIDAVEDAF